MMRALFEFHNRPLLFEHPRRLIHCGSAGELSSCFDRVEQALAEGYHVAGFLSYEAGYALEPALAHLQGDDFPLMCLGVFDAPTRRRPRIAPAPFEVSGLRTNISREDYTQAIARIHDHIREGNVYQITYCLKNLFGFNGSAYSLYRHLLSRQPVPYPAYLETPEHTILSLSPEMFIRKAQERVQVKPMKGSWPRSGRTLGGVDDIFGGMRLHFDSKNRAENVMIADLLRNDLGRVGTGVRTPRLFEVAAYRTIFQMTSTVEARIPAGLSFIDLFRAIFPSGSVTGAPKVRAMGIIHGLEREPRRIYTGAIGWITPERDVFFNVPIRTLLLRRDQGEMGVGGGIVWDSTAEGEWAEGLWKSRFLRAAVRAPCSRGRSS